MIELTITGQIVAERVCKRCATTYNKNIYLLSMIRNKIFLKTMTFTIKSETDNKISEIVKLGQQLMQHKSSQQGRSAAQHCQ